MRGRAIGSAVVSAGALVGGCVGGGDEGWAGHVGGEGGAMVASGGCPVKGLVLCHVGGAGVAVRELSVALVKGNEVVYREALHVYATAGGTVASAGAMVPTVDSD
jgi:hypothetical protein